MLFLYEPVSLLVYIVLALSYIDSELPVVYRPGATHSHLTGQSKVRRFDLTTRLTPVRPRQTPSIDNTAANRGSDRFTCSPVGIYPYPIRIRLLGGYGLVSGRRLSVLVPVSGVST